MAATPISSTEKKTPETPKEGMTNHLSMVLLRDTIHNLVLLTGVKVAQFKYLVIRDESFYSDYRYGSSSYHEANLQLLSSLKNFDYLETVIFSVNHIRREQVPMFNQLLLTLAKAGKSIGLDLRNNSGFGYRGDVCSDKELIECLKYFEIYFSELIQPRIDHVLSLVSDLRTFKIGIDSNGPEPLTPGFMSMSRVKEIQRTLSNSD